MGIFRHVFASAFGVGDEDIKMVFNAVLKRLDKKEEKVDPNWKKHASIILVSVLEELHEQDVASNETLAELFRKIHEWGKESE